MDLIENLLSHCNYLQNSTPYVLKMFNNLCSSVPAHSLLRLIGNMISLSKTYSVSTIYCIVTFHIYKKLFTMLFVFCALLICLFISSITCRGFSSYVILCEHGSYQCFLPLLKVCTWGYEITWILIICQICLVLIIRWTKI